MGKPRARRMTWRRAAVPVALTCSALLSALAATDATAQPPPPGGLTQLSGTPGCVSIDGTGGSCATAATIDGAESATVSPDGSNVYVGSYKVSGSGPGLTIFTRDPKTGGLTQLPGQAGCLTGDFNSSTCNGVRGLGSVGDGADLAFTSDGHWAYMAGQDQSGSAKPTIMLFTRDPSTGAMSQPAAPYGCVSSDGSSQLGSNTCDVDPTLVHPDGVTISPDDQFLYVTDYGAPSGVKVFRRDLAAGALTRVQCLEVSPAAGTCTTARDVGGASNLVISSDGRHAYGADAAANGISIFDRDPMTGLLTQKPGNAGCISDNGNDNTGASTCAQATGVRGAHALALSPNGQTLYVTATTDNGVAIFNVNSDGTLAQLSGTDGCITINGSSSAGPGTCAVGRALTGPYVPAVSPNGRALYVPSKVSGSGGVAIFALDATGKPTQLPGAAGCITADGSSGCTTGRAVAGGSSIGIDPTSNNAYLAAYDAQAVAAFTIENGPMCGPLVHVSSAYQKPVKIALSCQDRDGDTVTRTIISPPTHGSLGPIDQASDSVTYTPDSSFTRYDQFTFSASDGTNTSPTAIAEITADEPHLGRLRQSGSRVHLGHGPTFRFTLNEQATVTLRFELLRHGKQPRLLGKLTVDGHAGRNHVRLKLRLRNGHKLKPGNYKVWLVADNLAGSSRAKPLTFSLY